MHSRLKSIFCLVLLLAVGPGYAADWPQWRGPDRTDVSTEAGVLKSWPEAGPGRLWVNEDAGIGYAGFAVVGGRLYTMGARGDATFVIALSVADGEELWAARVGEMLNNGWGDGPRGTPTLDAGLVYALGGRGDLVCLRAADGRELWRRNMKEFGGRVPGWGYTESVLVDGPRVVCTPGESDGAMVALDKRTGKLLWQCEEFKDGAQYSSIIVANHSGKRQYIQLTQKSVVGVDAETGALLWRSDWPGRTAVIPTPIYHNGHVYVTSGYGVGCKLIRLDENHNASDVWDNKHMKNHHGGVILLDGHVYGYSDNVGWVCQDFRSGEIVWREKEKLGKGAIAHSDGRFYCLEEDSGTLVLIDASPEGWRERGRFRLEPQSGKRSRRGKVWTHPVISDGRLYLRDQEVISCYDVRESS